LDTGNKNWSKEEAAQRDRVLARIRAYTIDAKTIPLKRQSPDFSGQAGGLRYFFEGEDDLLHLIIERADGSDLEMNESGDAARFLLPDVPEAMIWMRPGRRAHHYYLGHDLLVSSE
jgi:hypothetical protein